MQAPLKDSLISQYKANELTADTIIYQLQSNINDLNNLNTEQGKKITRLRWNVLKVGVIGCGHLGKFHTKMHTMLEDISELQGVYDINPDQSKKVSEEYGR